MDEQVRRIVTARRLETNRLETNLLMTFLVLFSHSLSHLFLGFYHTPFLLCALYTVYLLVLSVSLCFPLSEPLCLSVRLF